MKNYLFKGVVLLSLMLFGTGVLADNGIANPFVKLAPAEVEPEVYGPIYIPADDLMLSSSTAPSIEMQAPDDLETHREPSYQGDGPIMPIRVPQETDDEYMKRLQTAGYFWANWFQWFA